MGTCLSSAGVLATSDILIYGVAGIGVEWYLPQPDLYNEAVYQLGGGIEVATTDNIAVHGQVTGIGYIEGDEVFDAIRPTLGVTFHF